MSFGYTAAFGLIEILALAALIARAQPFSLVLVGVALILLWQRVRWAKALGERNYGREYMRNASAELGLPIALVFLTCRVCDLLAACLLLLVIFDVLLS